MNSLSNNQSLVPCLPSSDGLTEGAAFAISQMDFSGVEFAENPEPRCPCVLLLDTSGSMQGAPISELNRGLEAFQRELCADSLAAKRVELAVVRFGPVEVVSGFGSALYFSPPSLNAGGDTPMGRAILTGLGLLEARKQEYRENGISFYRPWVFLITDGAPTDAWQEAARAVREGESAKRFSFFAVGVENADLNILSQIALRQPLRLRGLQFRELFVWLSNSMRMVSHSTPGTAVALSSPQGWACV